MKKLNGLSIFSGIGGIELGLSEWVETKAYCEINPYAQAVLRSRMENAKRKRAPEGHRKEKHRGEESQQHPNYTLSAGKIYGDIKKLTGEQVKREVGEIDIIMGGFPCQDISVAGKRRGIHQGERSGLWSEMFRIVREVRPRYVFVENVPGILAWFPTHQPLEGKPIRGGGREVEEEQGIARVLIDLAQVGYDAVWTTLRASDVGAPHRRERWFLLAFRNAEAKEKNTNQGTRTSNESGVVHSKQLRCESGWDNKREHEICQEGKQVAQVEQQWEGLCTDPFKAGSYISYTSEQGVERQEPESKLREQQPGLFAKCDIWEQDPAELDLTPKPRLGGVANGVPKELDQVNEKTEGMVSGAEEKEEEKEVSWEWEYTPRVTTEKEYRTERLVCLGNAVVPQQAREAFIRLFKIKEMAETEGDARNKQKG